MNSRAQTSPARFVTGSTMRHVVVMAGTGAVGLMAVFAVDLANLFYVSLLGDTAVAAAVGFAGTINFFHVAISIGMKSWSPQMTSEGIFSAVSFGIRS